MNFSPLPPQSSLALGQHVIADFFEAAELESCLGVEEILQASAEAAGAVVLEIKLHDFGDRSGFTGVALLAESHISIHTWPEYGYAAIDIFMCGIAEVESSLQVLRQHFKPQREDRQTLNRGALSLLSAKQEEC